MKPKPPPGKERTGKRAPGKVATTISLSQDTLDFIRQQAAAEDRTVSSWLRRLVERCLRTESVAQVHEPPATYHTSPKPASTRTR